MANGKKRTISRNHIKEIKAYINPSFYKVGEVKRMLICDGVKIIPLNSFKVAKVERNKTKKIMKNSYCLATLRVV